MHNTANYCPDIDSAFAFNGILGTSSAMQRVFDLIKKVSDTDTTVLVTGESGTGKELVAKAIHQNSTRNNKPLVSINCAAIPEGIIESELFGHEKGAFTGAIRTRIGKFEIASTGTVFLDEIGDMSPTMQVKLLRVLQEQEIERVGSEKTFKIDVRIIAATNKDLEQSIKDNSFREDLYYRLNIIPISIPPLRQRRDDIPILVNFFLNYFNQSKSKDIQGISNSTIGILLDYDWPGNVRELENIMERMVILKGEGTITPDDVPEKILNIQNNSSSEISAEMQNEKFVLMERENRSIYNGSLPDNGISLKDKVDEFEKGLIMEALEKSNWVKNKAAKLLGMNRTTLVEKMKKKGISVDDQI